MKPLARVIASAQRRAFVQAWVRRGGMALVAGLGVGLSLVVLNRSGIVDFNLPDTGWLNAALIGGPAALGAFAVAAWAWFTRPTPAQAASRIDAALQLDDALASAHLLERRPGSTDGFGTLAIQSGEAAAARLSPADLRRAMPLKFSRVWVASPLLLAAGVCAAIMLPGNWFSLAKQALRAVPANPAPTPAEVTRAQQEVLAAQKVLEAVQTPARSPDLAGSAGAPDVGDASAREASPDSAALAELQKQLENRSATPQQAREQVAQAVERAAESLETRAAEAEAASAALRDRLAEMQRAQDAPVNPAELTRALREGDLDAASRAAAELSRTLDSMPAAEREKLAKELQQVAEDLKTSPPGTDKKVSGQSPATPDGNSNPAEQRPSEAPQQAAPQPPAPQPPAPQPATTQPPTPQPPADRPTEPNADAARDSQPAAQTESKRADAQHSPEDSRPSSSPPNDQQSQQQAERQAEALSERLRDAARELQKPEPKKPTPRDDDKKADPRREAGEKPASPSRPDSPPPATENQPPTEPTGESPSDRQASPESREQKRPAPPQGAENGKQNGKAEPSPTPQPSSTPATSPSSPDPTAKPSPSGQQQPGQRQQSDTPKPAPGSEPQPRPDAQPPAKAEGQGQPRSEQTPTTKPEQTGTPGEKPAPQQKPEQGSPGEQPTGQRPEQQPGGQSGDQQSAPAPGTPESQEGKPDLSRLREQIDQLRRERDGAKQDRQDAQKLREQAERLWDEATPQQREQLEQLARELARDQPPTAEGSPPGQSDPKTPQESANAGKPGRPGGEQAEGQTGRDRGAGSDSPGGLEPGRENGSDRRAAPRPGTAGREQVFDARDKTTPLSDPGRTIAEWLSKNPVPGSVPSKASPAVTDAVRQATRSAEQAIEQRVTPPRLNSVIKRYFDRLPGQLGVPATNENGPTVAPPPVAPATPAPAPLSR